MNNNPNPNDSTLDFLELQDLHPYIEALKDIWNKTWIDGFDSLSGTYLADLLRLIIDIDRPVDLIDLCNQVYTYIPNSNTKSLLLQKISIRLYTIQSEENTKIAKVNESLKVELENTKNQLLNQID